MYLNWADGNGGRKLIDLGGGYEKYILPTASPFIKGGVKVGNGLYMFGEFLNALPLGGVSLGEGFSLDDGTLQLEVGGGLSWVDGVLNVAPLGGISLGEGFSLDDGVLNLAPSSHLPNVYFAGNSTTLPEELQAGCIAIVGDTPQLCDGEKWIPLANYAVEIDTDAIAQAIVDEITRTVRQETNYLKLAYGDAL